MELGTMAGHSSKHNLLVIAKMDGCCAEGPARGYTLYPRRLLWISPQQDDTRAPVQAELQHFIITEFDASEYKTLLPHWNFRSLFNQSLHIGNGRVAISQHCAYMASQGGDG
jgi:hypothetical protein